MCPDRVTLTYALELAALTVALTLAGALCCRLCWPGEELGAMAALPLFFGLLGLGGMYAVALGRRRGRLLHAFLAYKAAKLALSAALVAGYAAAGGARMAAFLLLFAADFTAFLALETRFFFLSERTCKDNRPPAGTEVEQSNQSEQEQ